MARNEEPSTIQELGLMIGKGFAGVDKRFDKVDDRLEKIETRLYRIEYEILQDHADRIKRIEELLDIRKK